MKILVILAHPDKKSFNHAIAETCVNTIKKKNHDIIYHDLYEEGFDPILPNREISQDAQLNSEINKHCDDLIQADGIIIIHPNWWGQPPAILKGWIDRVLRPGIAYQFEEGDKGEGIPQGLIKSKVAIVFNTSNTPEEREINVFKDPLERLWKDCIFDFCGVKQFYRKMYKVVVTSTHDERKRWLKEIEQTIDKYI